MEGSSGSSGDGIGLSGFVRGDRREDRLMDDQLSISLSLSLPLLSLSLCLSLGILYTDQSYERALEPEDVLAIQRVMSHMLRSF